MNIVRICWRLLRYRVAVMLLLFMLLGIAIHNGFRHGITPQMALAAFALAFSYISATSVNDIADRKIDAINHKDSPGRPLITGEAKAEDLWLVFAIASVLAVGCAALINPLAALIISISIAINAAYSLPPIRLSYRTFLAPLVLGLAYVFVPYTLGLAILRTLPSGADYLWLAGFYLLFVGRIILKDFRDRKGDATYNKPTFLLKFGKDWTCFTSIVCVLAGSGIVIWEIRNALWLVACVGLYLGAIVFMLVQLADVPEGKEEQASIGVGAKMGNGLLITILATYTLIGAGIAMDTVMVVSGVITGLFLANFFLYLRYPDRAVIGYRG